MKIFKTVSMSTWDIGVIKIAVAAIAFAIGSNWPELFTPYTPILVLIGIAAGAYASYSWLRK